MASFFDGKQPLNLQPRSPFAVAKILGEILVCTRNLAPHSCFSKNVLSLEIKYLEYNVIKSSCQILWR